MTITEIKELTFKKDGTCIINGEVMQLEGIQLPVEVDFVQYHSVFNYYIEEPAMVQVPLEKYSIILSKWNEYVREPLSHPIYNEATQKLVENGTVVVDGLTYKNYDVVALTQEELEANFKASVPNIITIRQAREQLIRDGLFANIETAIVSIVDLTEQAIVRNYWEYSDMFERQHPTLLTLATLLGLSDTDLDTLFIDASKL